MSRDEPPYKCCKPRFKGVENFLRRIAFNLGNSPSQTEVKIISCIPIDVTDLQQKIICLEKQLEEAKQCHSVAAYSATGPLPTGPLVQAALCRGGCQPPQKIEQCQQCHIRACRSSALMSIPPPSITKHPIHLPPSASSEALANSCGCKVSNAFITDDRKGIFNKYKRRKSKKKEKPKTQFVYYAQTTTGPFNDHLEIPGKSSTKEHETMNRSYISEMIRKQYAPVAIAQELSTTSQFSSPICRDVDACPLSNSYESDICSCCHGAFHNIDQHMATHNYTNVLNTFPTCSYKESMNNASFYDSSLYDMVPVRDKPARTASPSYGNPKRKVPKSNLNATYRPENKRSKTRFQPLIIKHYARSPPVVNYTKKAPVKLYVKKENVRRVSTKRDQDIEDKIKRADTSNSCCIDCGDVYIKHMNAINKKQASIKSNKSATCKNAECLTNILNDTECQTTTTQSVQIEQDLLEEKKTEETLNQIKSILQSVLTEVKTSAQLKITPEVKDKPTKDAVVQKGTSQGNMPGCSSLLHSFSYSPYNMDPYIASCSRQMNSGPCCFPTLPYPSAKCMQNFPVFIQTPGRHMCSSCYRNPCVPKVQHSKPATTAATNTDSKERSKETEKLIKEIYKSVAGNMEFPTKDTSTSEYNDLKSTPRVSVNKPLYRPSVLDEGMRKFMQANASRSLQKSATPATTLNSRLMSNTLSMRSQIVSSTDTERNVRSSRIENYLKNIDAHRKRQNKIEEERYEEQSPDTASDEEPSDSDTTVQGTYVQQVEEPVKKPEKQGLFSKMLNSVKRFNKKSRLKQAEEQVQVQNKVDEESDENSDDYQTIYSQREERRPRYVHAVRSPHKLRAHSKISYSRHMRDRQERYKRAPYMEQEYRRHWNERLMFHENQNRYSSDSPFSKDTPRHWRTPAYCTSKDTPRHGRTPLYCPSKDTSRHVRTPIYCPFKDTPRHGRTPVYCPSKDTPRHGRTPIYWNDYETRRALVNNQHEPSRVGYHSEQNRRPIVTRDDILRTINANENGSKMKAAKKGLSWLKKHQPACAPQWKKFVLES